MSLIRPAVFDAMSLFLNHRCSDTLDATDGCANFQTNTALSHQDAALSANPIMPEETRSEQEKQLAGNVLTDGRKGRLGCHEAAQQRQDCAFEPGCFFNRRRRLAHGRVDMLGSALEQRRLMIEPIDGSMVHALHRHWKPTKQSAAAGPNAAPIRIRIHRCLSWMQRVEDIGASAATHGGNRNRNALRRCSIMLSHLLPAMLLVIMDHAWQEDWGDLRYPPMD